MVIDDGAADAVAAGVNVPGSEPEPEGEHGPEPESVPDGHVDDDGSEVSGISVGGVPTGGRKTYDWVAIQHAYEETDLTIAQMQAVFGMSTSALYRRIRREHWRRRQDPDVGVRDMVQPVAGAPMRSAMPTTTAGLRSFRKGMIVRLYEAMERQLADIEQQQIGGLKLSGADRERQTRQMNVMTRSMEKLAEFHEQEASRETRGRKKADAKSEAQLRDPETWRLEIAKRITRIRETWLAEEASGDG